MKGGLLLSLLKSLPRLKFGRRVTALAVVGTVVASSLVGGGAVLAAAASAEAYAPSASATCSVLSVNLQGYQDIVPEKPAVPGTPGQQAIEPTYETVIVTPEIPAKPAIPATYVQEWLYVQKNHSGQTKWAPEGWNGIVHGVDHGQGWRYAQPEQHRDTKTVLTPPIPAVPAVPAITKQVMTDPGRPYIAPVEGQDAVPAKVNTVKVTIDGMVVEDATFGASFAKTYDFGDETVAHTWHVQAVAWNDSQLNVDQSGTTTPCAAPPIVVDAIVAPPAANPATCEADGSLPTLLTFDDYTFAWDRSFDGPGTYIATASAKPGKIFKADLKNSFDVIVPAKLSGEQCAPAYTPDWTVYTNAKAQCINGEIVLAGYVRNDTNEAFTARMLSSFGDSANNSVVQPGKAAYFQVKTGVKLVEAGTVTFRLYRNVEGKGYSMVTGPVAYGEAACAILPPPMTVINTQPEAPTFNDVCGTVNDRTDGPLDTGEYTYSKVVEGVKTTVTVTPRDEYTTFGPEIVTEWTHAFTDEPCPTETAAPTPTPTESATPAPTQSSTPSPTATQQPTAKPTATKPAVVVPQGASTPTTKSVTPVAAKNVLAYTGINPVLPIVGLALAVLAIGLAVMFASRRRRAHQHN